jgi:hypothetical protein
MLILEYEDPEEHEQMIQRARELAKVARAQFPTESEEFYFGAALAALTMHVVATQNGPLFRFPILAPTDAYRATERLVSFETMLPFIDRDVSEKEARLFAARFRGIAEICDHHAEEAKREGRDFSR